MARSVINLQLLQDSAKLTLGGVFSHSSSGTYAAYLQRFIFVSASSGFMKSCYSLKICLEEEAERASEHDGGYGNSIQPLRPWRLKQCFFFFFLQLASRPWWIVIRLRTDVGDQLPHFA
jgi:hypothetical protein